MKNIREDPNRNVSRSALHVTFVKPRKRNAMVLDQVSESNELDRVRWIVCSSLSC